MLGIGATASEIDETQEKNEGFDPCCGLEFIIPGHAAPEIDDKWGSASLAETNEALGKFHETSELKKRIDVNPNYDCFDQFSPWNKNCSSCSLAVLDRMNGDNPGAMACRENLAPTVSDMERITGMEQVEMTPMQIYQHALIQGSGYTGICGYDRAQGPDGTSLDGHWICVHTGEHGVYALDGQTDTVMGFLDYVEQDPGIRYDLSIRR
jgi:hypothetical protein